MQIPSPQREAASCTDRADSGRSVFVTTQDGLRLHVREYGQRTAPALPVVCLPGLAWTVDEFDALAPALADERERVIIIDSRHREHCRAPSRSSRWSLVSSNFSAFVAAMYGA
jgi:hypothetical protein